MGLHSDLKTQSTAFNSKSTPGETWSACLFVLINFMKNFDKNFLKSQQAEGQIWLRGVSSSAQVNNSQLSDIQS